MYESIMGNLEEDYEGVISHIKNWTAAAPVSLVWATTPPLWFPCPLRMFSLLSYVT
jgi:hypothetical protein